MYATITFLLILFFLPLSVQLDFFCFPNGTLLVTNPNKDLDAVNVQDEFDLCRPSLNEDNSILRLDGCKMDHHVQVLFYKKSSDPIIIGGKNKVGGPYGIMCKNIPKGGIEITIRASLGTKTHVEEVDQEASSVQVARVFSHVEDENSQQFQTLRLNDKFEWVFEIRDSYHTIPESCTAYAGRKQAGDVESMVLMEDGCSKNKKVLSHFITNQGAEVTEKNRYTLNFSVFRFENNPFITVVCRMRVCSDAQGHECRPKCNDRRRKRSTGSDDTTKEMAVVVEVLDERSPSQPPTETGNTPSDRTEEMWKLLLADVMSGANGLSVTMPTIITAILMLTMSHMMK